MPFKYIYFTYSGKATLCCRDYEEELVIGDIQENAIIDLWNGLKAESIREKHLNLSKMNIRPCLVCSGPYPVVSDVINQFIHFLDKEGKHEETNFCRGNGNAFHYLFCC